MSAATGKVEQFGPAWVSRPVVIVNGQHDTRMETGEDYDSTTLGALFLLEPGDKDKLDGRAFIPSSHCDYDARNHARQREVGSFVALTGDVDSGNHPLRDIESLVRGLCRDAAWLIYSSAHARPGDMRWRIIIPLENPLPFDEWHDAQNAFFRFMERAGVEMDRALDRAGQLVFLPNVPGFHSKTGEPLRGEDGAPLYYTRATTGCNAPGLALDKGVIASGIAEIRRQRAEDERERERIRKEADERRANRPKTEGAPIIEDFNRENPIPRLLELYGYQQSPRHGEDWRSPHQTSESYATRVMGDKWVSLSASDVGQRLGENFRGGCFGDAYDLFVHFEHGGDHKAAFRTLYSERRAATMPAYNPPPHDPEDPGWTEEIATFEEGDPVIELPDETLVTPSLPFFWFNEAEPDLNASDFVEGLLTSGSMSVVYGPSNCGKTFFIVDLALHVAWGRKWRDREVDRGAVVYLSLEGAQGIRNRLTAFRKHHGLDGENLPFVAMPKPVNLLNDDADVNAVIGLVHHVAETTELPVAMVIIDTLSRAMAGGNENSPEDMTALIGNCDRIRDATQAHVCIVHHSGKDEARGARGHSSLRAATDTEIEIKRDPELTFSSVRIAKQRDLEAGDPFGFTLKSIPLGTNRRGKDVTSCVVLETEQTVILSRDPDKLSPKETAAFECLERCLGVCAFEFETPEGDVVNAVTLHAWKRSMQSFDIVSRDDNTSRPQLYRVKNALEKKGKIAGAGGNVWLA